MDKRFLSVLIIILMLFSVSVYGFSVKEYLENFKETGLYAFMSGKIVSQEALLATVKQEISCTSSTQCPTGQTCQYYQGKNVCRPKIIPLSQPSTPTIQQPTYKPSQPTITVQPTTTETSFLSRMRNIAVPTPVPVTPTAPQGPVIVREPTKSRTLKSELIEDKPNCLDSDGGENFFVYGYVKEGVEPYLWYKDKCEGEILIEYFCKSDKTTALKEINCIKDLGAINCFEGRCIKEKKEVKKIEVKEQGKCRPTPPYYFKEEFGKCVEECQPSKEERNKGYIKKCITEGECYKCVGPFFELPIKEPKEEEMEESCSPPPFFDPFICEEECEKLARERKQFFKKLGVENLEVIPKCFYLSENCEICSLIDVRNDKQDQDKGTISFYPDYINEGCYESDNGEDYFIWGEVKVINEKSEQIDFDIDSCQDNLNLEEIYCDKNKKLNRKIVNCYDQIGFYGDDKNKEGICFSGECTTNEMKTKKEQTDNSIIPQKIRKCEVFLDLYPGDNPYLKSFVKWGGENLNLRVDSCLDMRYKDEWSCDPVSDSGVHEKLDCEEIATEIITMPDLSIFRSEGVCYRGRCLEYSTFTKLVEELEENIWCEESDGGEFDYFTEGAVFIPKDEMYYYDICLNDDLLKENWCEENEHSSKVIKCSDIEEGAFCTETSTFLNIILKATGASNPIYGTFGKCTTQEYEDYFKEERIKKIQEKEGKQKKSVEEKTKQTITQKIRIRISDIFQKLRRK